MSTQVLLDALQATSEVTLLTHQASLLPRYVRQAQNGSVPRVVLGSQPFAVHGEAIVAGRIHRKALRTWDAAWAVNSRYASSLYAAGVPYVIWEATTIRDELQASPFREIRRAGRGSGFGRTLHVATLPIGERLESAIYRNAYRVLTMSRYTRERIMSQYSCSGDHVQVLTHPPTRAFLSVVAARSNGDGRRSPPAEPWRLLFVGRVDDPRKNFALLLGAVRKLVAEGRAFTLTAIGPHNEYWRDSLKLAGLGDTVALAGPVSLEALVDAYLNHDVLVLPSRQEGFGIVVAEALWAGLPVVATRCGGPEDLIQRSAGGVLVDHSADALATAISAVLGAPERVRRMQEAAQAFAKQDLSFEAFSARVRDVTLDLLAARRNLQFSTARPV